MEVNSLRSWELKWTIPYRLSASKAIVQHAVLNFQPASRLNSLFNFMDALAPWRAVKRGASYNSRNLN